MPKDKRRHSHSSSKSRTAPYSCNSDNVVHPLSKKSLDSVEDVKEWEEARCPVCMEHPHNAVLLLCSSYKKGCHPYMCDTSHRHSNCLDLFRKAFAATPESPSHDETLQSNAATGEVTRITVQRSSDLEVLADQTPPAPPPDDKTQLKLVCPLCRGQVNGWVVVERARRFMNAKTRSCACETCDFSGMYADLRRHARVKHPLVRPSEADPERQRDWRRMEQERDLMDVLSTIQSAFAEERDEVSVVSLRLFFIFSRLSETQTSSWPSNSSRARVHLRRRSRTSPVTLSADDLHTDTDTDSDALEEDSFDVASSPGYSPSHEQGDHQRNQRQERD